MSSTSQPNSASQHQRNELQDAAITKLPSKANKSSLADLLFDGKLGKEEEKLSRKRLQQTAISYVDEDYTTHHLTYDKLLQYCRKIVKQLSQLKVPKTRKRIDGVSTDYPQQELISVEVPPIIVLYGDCAQFTLVFMTAISQYGVAFYSIERPEQLKEALQVLPPRTLVAFITHTFRINDLKSVLQLAGEAIGAVQPMHQHLQSEYHIICLREIKKEEKLMDSISKIVHELPIAYLINTSGTSGSLASAAAVTSASTSSSSSSTFLTPSSKYVFVPQQAIVENITNFSKRFSLNSDHKNVVFLCSPFTFDPALCDAFLALFEYAHLVTVCNSLRNSPDRMRAIIIQFGVTYATFTPSLWRKLTSSCDDRILKELLSTFKQLNFGGELSPSLDEVSSISRLKPALKIFNFYGVTEVSAWASVFAYNSENMHWANTESGIRKRFLQKHCLEFMPINDPSPSFFTDKSSMLSASIGLKDDEIYIRSIPRRCLIFTPPPIGCRSSRYYTSHFTLWAFNTVHFTGDRGFELVDEMEKICWIFFDGRLCQDDFEKVNGIKCWPEAIAKSIREKFSRQSKYRRRFIVLHSLAVVSSWHGWPNALVDLILVIERRVEKVESTACRWEKEVKQIVLKEVRKRFGFSFAYRIHLHEEATMGADVLNRNGKLDAGRLKQLAERQNRTQSTTTIVGVEQTYQRRYSIKRIICSLIASLIGKTTDECMQLDNNDLNSLGVPSIGRLQLTVQIEEAFANRFSLLDAEAIQSFFNIVNSCPVGRIVQYVRWLFGENVVEKRTDELFFKKLPSPPPKPTTATKTEENIEISKFCAEQVSQLSHRVNVVSNSIAWKYIVEPFSFTPQWSYFMQECVDSTPLIVVYKRVTYLIIASHSGIVAALDAYNSSYDPQKPSYTVLWTKQLSSRIDSSPVGSTDGSLIFICPHSPHIIALSTSSGDIVWSYQTGSSMKNTPTVVDRQVLCGSFDHHVYCWEAKSGRLEWSVDLKAGGIAASPVVFGRQKAAGMRVLIATVTGVLVALSLENGHELWRIEKCVPGDRSDCIFATPLVMRDRAFVCLVQEYIVCISLRDYVVGSRIIWRTISPVCGRYTSVSGGGDHFCPPVGVQLPGGGQLIILATHNHCVLALNGYGIELWRAETESAVNSVPFIIGNGVIVVDTLGNMQMLNLFSGQPISGRTGGDQKKKGRDTSFKIADWTNQQQQKELIPMVHSSPIVYGSKLFIGARDNFLHCFHLNFTVIDSKRPDLPDTNSKNRLKAISIIN